MRWSRRQRHPWLQQQPPALLLAWDFLLTTCFESFVVESLAGTGLQLGEPMRRQSLTAGGKLAIYRHRLASANQYVRVNALQRRFCVRKEKGGVPRS